MYVLDSSILDDAVALDVSWDLAHRNIDNAMSNNVEYREGYNRQKQQVRILVNRAMTIEYDRDVTASTISTLVEILSEMGQCVADYQFNENAIEKGWEQVYKVLGTGVYWR